MAEYTNSAVQTVATNQNVVFTETAVNGTRCITHREGSGIVTLRGLTNQCRAMFRVTFNGNIAVPADGTAGAISLATAISGEALTSSTAIYTPTAVSTYGNVSLDTIVSVPQGCCLTIGIKNTATQAIDVQNANLIIERVS